MKNEKEQILVLKDGRTLFKTHNGFKSFLQEKNGNVVEVTEEYYQKSKHLAVNLKTK